MTFAVSDALVRKYFPKLVDVDVWVSALNEAMLRFEITTRDRAAAFLAQIAHECGVSAITTRVRLVENLNYSASGLIATWPGRFPTLAVANQYARQPERIANKVYANRLGNGDEASGDGWRFRGRGLMQVTGRANYRAAGAALGLDLETNPAALEQPLPAALAAAHFWQVSGLNELADDRLDDDDVADFTRISKVINGGYNGLADRQARWGRTIAALEA